MNEKDTTPLPLNYFIKPGYIFISTTPTIISTVLGSCVSVCLHDRNRKIGGMNHFKMPFVRDPDKATANYGNVATFALIRMILQDGSKREDIEAQIFGGAHHPELCSKDIGRENIRIARKILERENFRIVSEDVGGQMGRKVVFDTAKNEAAVIKAEKLRKYDWFPYIGER